MYNDQLASPEPLVECVVCHETASPSTVHWHIIRLDRPVTFPDYPDGYVELLVPVCFSCADLFHDVPRQANKSTGR